MPQSRYLGADLRKKNLSSLPEDQGPKLDFRFHFLETLPDYWVTDGLLAQNKRALAEADYLPVS